MSATTNHLHFATIVEASRSSLTSLWNRIPNHQDFEESIVGKSSFTLSRTNNHLLSSMIIAISVVTGLVSAVNSSTVHFSSSASDSDLLLHGIITFFVAFFAYWVTLTAMLKFTFRKSLSNTILGIATAWIIFIVVRGLSNFVLIDADWVVVWANRDLVMMGQLMKEQMTQSPGSHVCIDVNDCYGINQNFRLWWSLYLTCGLFGTAYGASGDKSDNDSVKFWKPVKFLISFTLFAVLISLIATNPTEVSYNTDVVMQKILICMAITYATFGASYYYSINSEEYQINRLKSYLTIAAVFVFFFAILIMDPPTFVKDIAAFLGGTPVQSMSDDIIAGTVVPSTLDKLAGDGIQASQWGGLFVNLIVATAGCVLGFGIGVVLAFGRQSELPFFRVPSVALIELVRSGPLICWLYFAVFMMPDMMDPFYNAEDIIRMLLMFGDFGGCYIAEVLRGGLQAVDSGQKEAAIALGLSPFQTKIQIELPNAVRTTLPSIVSVFIGLWKDTTLLFIVNILDFFKLAKDLPNTDLRFLGDFLEPLYITAVVFWVFAFYLSRISMGIEKSLGLVKEGGGELA